MRQTFIIRPYGERGRILEQGGPEISDAHIFDAVWKGLGLTAPLSVVARVQDSWQESSERNRDTWPTGRPYHFGLSRATKFTRIRCAAFGMVDGEVYPPWEVQALFMGKHTPQKSASIGTEVA